MDTKRIDELAQLMESHGLTRLKLEQEDGRIELERAAAPVAVACAPAAPSPAPAEPKDAEPELRSPEGEPLDMTKVTVVSAPMVGVFYAAPSPGAEPFVRVGSKVHKGDTLCVIEAMKLMNEVTAERDGEVVDVCATDGELVEYGCCLMKIY